MAAIDYLREKGLTAQRVGNRVRLKPKSLITEDVRQFVKSHRLVLLAELAANDGETRRMSWTVTRDGQPLCTMIGEPTTYHEAQQIARWRWPGADVR